MSSQLPVDSRILDTIAAATTPSEADDTPTPSSPTRSLSITRRLLTAAMLTCFALGGWFFAQNGTSTAAVPVEAARPAVSSTAPEPQTQSIEQIRLGQRVSGRNPLREETQTPSRITPEHWRAVRLTMNYHGVRYDLAFLRSLDWLQATGATPGGNIHLSLPEMGLDGPALVESVDACPPIEPDDGTGRMIVTGTMRHLASNVLDVSVTGLDKPLGVTDTHPIWSETRHTFATAGQLKVGEHLRSKTGTLSQVTKVSPRRGPPQQVYNLEVDAEHVYRGAGIGLLVHNSCPTPLPLSGRPHGGTVHDSAIDDVLGEVVADGAIDVRKNQALVNLRNLTTTALKLYVSTCSAETRTRV